MIARPRLRPGTLVEDRVPAQASPPGDRVAAQASPPGDSAPVDTLPCGDRGAASVLVLAVGLVLLSSALVLAVAGAAVVARHQAQVAADLGALAGAARAVHGQTVACGRAAEFVAANEGRVVGCELAGVVLTVTVEVSPPPPLALPRPAVAVARAGPLEAPG